MAEQLKPCNIFHTPKDLDELQNWIKLHPDSDRGGLMTVMGMTWNLCAKLTSEEVTDEN